LIEKASSDFCKTLFRTLKAGCKSTESRIIWGQKYGFPELQGEFNQKFRKDMDVLIDSALTGHITGTLSTSKFYTREFFTLHNVLEREGSPQCNQDFLGELTVPGLSKGIHDGELRDREFGEEQLRK